MIVLQNMALATGGTMTGSGTTASPYLVQDYADLKAVGTGSYSLSAVYRLAKDIDASASMSENAGAGFVPKGTSTSWFSGTFHGAGYVIKNLYINRSTDYIGLFGSTNSATIDNLGLVNVTITGNSNVGGISGYCYYGTISNCYTTGSVTSGSFNVGGIVGRSLYGTITNCYSTAIVKSNSVDVGGVAGMNSGVISNSYAAGNVSGSGSIGGFVGWNDGTIAYCYWDTVTTSQALGYGQNSGTFSGSGLTTSQMIQSSSFSGWNFTSTWRNTNGSTFPGLRSVNNAPFAFRDTLAVKSTISRSILMQNDFDVETANSSLVMKVIRVYGSGSVDASGSYNYPTGAAYGYVDSLLHQVGEIVSTGDTLWSGKVVLVMIKGMAGNGTSGDPFLVQDYTDLEGIGTNQYSLSSVYTLANDIDASVSKTENAGAGFVPIGNSTTSFNGVFHGAGHVIKNLFINRPSTNLIGLFGYAPNAATTIDNLGLTNAAITGKLEVGGVVGFSTGTINNCYVTGTVTGEAYVGSIAGSQGGPISNCYATSSVTYSTNYAGGIVGYTEYTSSTITNCYAAGRVTGTTGYVGGIAGYVYNGGAITGCYWNRETTGQMNGSGYTTGTFSGSGLTTMQMKQSSNFSGWDFSGIWNISNGNTYPGLSNFNNAPFAFRDTLRSKTTISLSAMGAKDYDIENGRTKLVEKVIKVYGAGSVSGSSSYSFPSGAAYGYVDSLLHQAGEVISTGDTLWGNTAVTVLIKGMTGNGTDSDPFHIQDYADIEALGTVKYPALTVFRLDNDIDASASQTENNGAGFMPLRDVAALGKLHGGGHVINNLYINRPGSDTIGLFMCAALTTDSLGLTNVSITGRYYVGGFGGLNCTTISNCYVTGSVNGFEAVGGIAGYNMAACISNCYVTGNVMATYDAGGIAAWNFSSTISDCYASGMIVASGGNVGGIVVTNNSTGVITNCYWNTETTGQASGYHANVGTFTGSGLTTAQMQQSSSFSGWDFSGTWNISNGNTYPGLRSVNNAPFAFRDLLRFNTMISESNFLANDYDLESGQGSLTLRILQIYGGGSDDGSGHYVFPSGAAYGYVDSVLYQVGEPLSSGGTKWGNTSVAVLIKTQSSLSGSGTSSSPYLIHNYTELKLIANELTSVYRLANDIDASASKTDNSNLGFAPIGGSTLTAFTGTFHGAGHVIKNLCINRAATNYIGFFGNTSGATIDSLGMFNSNITGGSYTGGIVGNSVSGTINNCYVAGNILGLVGMAASYVGGIVGSSTGTINNCYTTGSVTANGHDVIYIGGIAGMSLYSVSAVTNCYTLCTIIANSANYVYYSGGIVGNGAAANCYVAGSMTWGGLYHDYTGPISGFGSTSNCYWNSETTGQSGGLTASQMKQASSFSGWNFSSVWTISSGNTFPGLRALNNAPFAFNDTLKFKTTTSLASLLANDYDIETGQTVLVKRVKQLYGVGSVDGSGNFSFPANTGNGYVDSLLYQVGEVLSIGDTLWGGIAVAVLQDRPLAGSGIITDPFFVTSYSDLKLIVGSTALSSEYRLANDIDASASQTDNGGAGFTPISNFSGAFHGAGHAINNLFISLPSTNYVGLFGSTSNATIDSLGVTNANITGSSYVGGVAGYDSAGTINYCYATGSIHGTSDIGGVAGWNDGAMNNCSASTSDSGATDVGGIVGGNGNTLISSYATGNVIGTTDIGSFAGYNQGTISLCHATGNVTGSSNVGGFAGYSEDTIASSYSTGTVTGGDYVGGFLGDNESAAIACYANGSVNAGGNNVGGLTGSTAGTINNCYALGTVNGNNNVGGVAGTISSGLIGNSFASGNVAGSGDNVGGVAGYTAGTINQCYDIGSVSGNSDVGGVAGNFSSGIINSCFASGNVNGSGNIGGAAGVNTSGKISNCYTTGIVSGNGSSTIGEIVGVNSGTVNNCYTMANPSGGWRVGEIAGYNYGSINYCYWNRDNSSALGCGQNDGALNGAGLTSAQMKQASNYSGWAFDTVWTIRTDSTSPGLRALNNVPFAFRDTLKFTSTKAIVDLLANDCDVESGRSALVMNVLHMYGSDTTDASGNFRFPQDTAYGHIDSLLYRVGEVISSGDTLWGNTVIAVLMKALNGSGVEGDPYLIADYVDLKAIGASIYPLSDVYRLTHDIDASLSITENSGLGFAVIGDSTTPFAGTLHGAGHSIKNLYINNPGKNYVGLFGYTSNVTIDSLGMTNVNITGGSYVGGIAGYDSAGTLNACHTTGTISGNTEVGGIAGWNDGSIDKCYTTGNENGSSDIGGIAGGNGSTVNYCYVTGTINGSTNLGGLAGYSEGTVNNCYTTGNVNGSNDVGGVVGDNEGAIIAGYATGSINGNYSVGEIVGFNDGPAGSCYWNSETTGLTVGCGTDSVGAFSGFGLTTAQMKQSSSFVGWAFDTVWTIRVDSTYPGLRGVDNAPFAFADTLASGRKFVLSNLLGNDDDIETTRQHLMVQVISSSTGTTDSVGILTFPNTAVNGWIDTIIYRVGEIRSIVDDTLWGGTVRSILTLDTMITTTPVGRTVSSTPNIFALNQNYPNPFNPSTTISFTLAQNGFTTLKIYDVLGREVATLVNGDRKAGVVNTVTFNASKLSSGVYFSRLVSSASVQVKKLVLMK
jgi:hypothetical protein